MGDTAIYDSLTGAYSRALFAEQLRAETERVRRYGSLCSLLVFDLDHFKSVNDAFGHARGDAVLIEVARRVRQITRVSDLFFRYGGDEFVLLLPNTTKAEAIHMAERLLHVISATAFDGPVPLTITLSVGVATFPTDAADAQALFQAADIRNYAAKRRGRAGLVAEDTSDTLISLPFSDGSRLIEGDQALETAQRFFTRLVTQQRGTLRVIGAPGTGRSRFLREVEKLSRLQGFAIVTIQGTATLKARPYGALTRGLPQLAAIPAQQINLELLIATLQQHLATAASAKLLLSIDDLAELDWGTLDLIRQLLLVAPFAVLGLTYTTDLAHARLTESFAAPFSDHVLLAPLSSTGLRVWLRVLMQWELPSPFIDWLEQQTHGLPAQVEQMLSYLIKQGALVKDGSGWQLSEQYQLIGQQAAMHAQRRARPHNLPTALTSFIGRDHELAEVRHLLPTTRLLTLIGPGGMGKTRLSLQVAFDILDNFQDGVWFVELASLSDPALVTPTLAAVLGIREQQSRPLLATILDWLTTKQLLIVLDNCEHLIDACAQLAERVLQSSAQVSILASSREALSIAGELAYRVPPLAMPDLNSQLSIEQLSGYPAARLFIARATAAKPLFLVTETNAPLIAQICHRLDGIPLALELAAVRVQTLSIEQIATRLDDRFRLLTGGSRTVLPRHQTLRALIDWSYGLLSVYEQALLRWLAVFPGGWTLEAAEAVCGRQSFAGDEYPATLDVLELLTQLVNKSLVMVDEQASEPRYRMLETIRQYAREKLLDAQEIAPLRDQHLRYYLSLAEQTEPLLISPQRTIWLPRLEAEADNLRAALEWAIERNIETARWMAGTLLWFWFYNDHLSEAHSWYARVLHADQPTTLTPGLALALWGSGNVATSLLYWDEAELALSQSIAMWQALNEPRRLGWTLLWLAYLMVFRGEGGRACAIFAAHETLLRRHSHGLLLVWVLMYWGRALMQVRHDDPLAKARLDEALTLGQVLQDPHGLTGCYLNLGHWALQQEDLVTSRHYYQDALACSRQLGTGWIVADTLRTLANVMWLQGDYLQAEPLYAEAVALARANGDQLGEANSTQALGVMALHAGDLPRAEALLSTSLAASCKWDSPLGIARCLRGFADLQRMQGSAMGAVQLLGFVEAWLQTNQLNWPPFDRTMYQRGLAAAHAQLDQLSFDAAWTIGQSLTLAQAIAQAGIELPG